MNVVSVRNISAVHFAMKRSKKLDTIQVILSSIFRAEERSKIPLVQRNSLSELGTE